MNFTTIKGFLAAGTVLLLLSMVACSKDDQAQQKSQLVADSHLVVPELFGAHLATDEDNRHSALTFSPAGDELYYSVYKNNQQPQKIFFSRWINGSWSEAAIASFSGTYRDGQPLFSPDGKRIYFYSNRPESSGLIPSNDYDIWYVERSGDGWGDPVNAGQLVNTDDDESVYTFSENGDFYFKRQTKDSKEFLLRSELVDGILQTPTIIKELSDQVSFVQPVAIEGQDYFIFTNNVQKGRFYYSALLISYKNLDGSWSPPKDMGDMINFGEGRFPSLSPDGEFLYFVSYRTGISQFYRVGASIIDYLKTADLNLIRQLGKTMLETDIMATRKAYKSLRQKHAKYYRFDKTLFNEVASELISNGAYAKATDVYELNFELYPQEQFYPQKLTVSLLNDDADEFNRISNLVEKESRETKRDLLDEFNTAGEIFLRNKMTLGAIKVFELNDSINPDSTWPSYKLGKAYFQLEYLDTARAYFKKALQLDQGNIYAENYLEEIGFLHLKGPYLGQEPPGMTPEIFAAGLLVARDGDAINSVFSPDGKEFYYVVLEDQSPRYNLWFTESIDGTWAKPGELRLAGDYEVADIALSPDGNRLYFCSDMPTFWEAAEGFDIWYVERTEHGWSDPINAGQKINSPGGETQPSFTIDGSMYFPSWHEGSQTDSVDLYYSELVDGEFSEPVRLPDSVNSEYNEGNSFVAPDGSFILFARWNMPESIDGGKGLYISFRKPDGGWTKAVNTAPVLAVRGSLAALTHDSKYLLWSTRLGIYWVDVKILERLKSDELK